MRKLTLGILGSLVALFATAQISTVDPYSSYELVGKQTPSDAFNGQSKYKVSNNGRLAAFGDTIFYSDFNSSTNWTAQANGTTRGWIIGNADSWWNSGNGISSTSGADWACLKPGDPRPGALPAADFNLTSSAINCTGKGSVILSFEQFYARFEDTALVQISTNGTSWTTVYDLFWLPITNVNGSFPTSNPLAVDVNISQLAANQATVYVRFRWISRQAVQPGIGYGWYIDDVLVSEGSPNDVSLTAGYAQDYSQCTYSHYEQYYSQVPQKQANSTNLSFAGKYLNLGSAAQTNLKLNVEGTGPGGYSVSGSSTGSTLPVGGTDSASIPGPFGLSGGQGDYEFNLFATSDSNLLRGEDDTITYDIEVTDSTYSRIVEHPSLGNNSRYYNPATITEYEIGQYFTIETMDTVSSVTFWLDGLNARNPNKQGTIKANIYNFSTYSCDTISGGLATAPLYESAAVKVSSLNPQANGSWVTLSVSNTQAGHADTIAPGGYVVTILADQFFGTDSVFFGYHDGYHNWHNYVRVNNGTWTNWSLTDNQYYINLNLKPTVCPILNGSVNATATTACGNTDGEAEVSDPTNGGGSYTYVWDVTGNPTTKKVTNLASGIYNVTIKDANGCSQVASATVSDAGAPTISNPQVTPVQCAGQGMGEIEFALVAGTSGPGYTYKWVDGAGNTITAGSGATRADSLLQGVEVGTYTVEVTDQGTPPCKQTQTWTITGANSVITSSHVATDVTCNGLTDGSGTLTIGGGSGNKSVVWPGGQTTLTVTGLAAGTHDVTITDDSACTSIEGVIVSEPAALVIRPIGPSNPLSTIEVDCDNTGDVTVTPRSGGGTGTIIYGWTGPEGTPSHDQNTGVMVLNANLGQSNKVNGTYTVTAVDDNACSNQLDFVINESCLFNVSVAEFGTNFEMNLFPNPNNGTFSINMLNADENDYTFEVTNMGGQVVYNETVAVSGTYNGVIDLNGSNSGVYFLSISNEKGTASYKIIVE